MVEAERMVRNLDDREIIELFFERSEQAIFELSYKYGSVCSKVAFNILNNKQDTEECVNDAYLGTWNTIPPHNPNPLLSYVCRIVRNLAIKKSLPIKDVFEVYGIDGAYDIVSIAPVKSDNSWKTDGKVITDRTIISEFFIELSALSAFCFDDYHDKVFANELQELEGENGGDIGTDAYTRVADDRKDIIVEAKDGLRFNVGYYPSYGWISISATMTYYQMSPEIAEWFSKYVK